MFKKNNKNNEEVIRMEQTTFIQRHAKKILIAGGLVVSAGAAYLLYKHQIDLKNKDIVIDGLAEALADTREDNQTLMEALSEGVFEEAIATVTRKINSRKDRKEFLELRLLENPDDMQTKAAYEKVVEELAILFKRKDKFLEGQQLYEIKNLED